ncbi:methyltransferase family protein [Tamilnaduibacter salinus]|uniref:Methyltransferase family protein n=1 Tax=Tamilnaduibacter salinus TaxID=1484056 RepID=A0A2U1CTP4_9GAMM|nr:class I SAM-dependent methyltransferase [Tamilnaduibacter salinus]PVY70071.1 methyltransferase family protein [Tamilnaduibacter salinus]
MDSKTLASQLRCPSGRDAVEVGERMNEANRLLNNQCIERLGMGADDSVLEIGPGNGAFVADIVEAARGVTYTGVDWSAEMVAEAERLNGRLIESGRARFRQGDAQELPFEAESFDKVLTIHTLYFWEQPAAQLAEIHRVLKAGGVLCLAFGDRSFMKDLPFVPYGFELYDQERIGGLLRAGGFEVVDACQHHEQALSNTGEVVEKLINIMICRAG